MWAHDVDSADVRRRASTRIEARRPPVATVVEAMAGADDRERRP